MVVNNADIWDNISNYEQVSQAHNKFHEHKLNLFLVPKL